MSTMSSKKTSLYYAYYGQNNIWNVLMLAHCGNIDTMSTMSTLATMLFPDTPKWNVNVC